MKTRNSTIKKRYAEMLRIKSDSLIGKIMPAKRYDSMFKVGKNLTREDLYAIQKMENITMEDAKRLAETINERVNGLNVKQRRFKELQLKKKLEEIAELKRELGIEPSLFNL